MFGYIRARQDTLSEELWRRYETVYCGLCHTLRENYGLASRMFLNYDFVFLAMLLSSEEEPVEVERRACLAHPLKKRDYCTKTAWLEEAAGKSVILSWWKLRDARQDEKGLRKGGAVAGEKLLWEAYCKAEELHREFAAATQNHLRKLQEMESSALPSLDRTADQFACLLAAAAPETGDPMVDRPRRELLYQIGRWIYLIDALDDREEDRRKGRYNPLLLRFPEWSGEEQEYFRRLLDQTLERAGAAFQLLPETVWTPILENILYSGLPGVESLVFSGEWNRKTIHRSGSDERSL